MSERETDRFYAQTDDGQMFTVVEYQENVLFRPLMGAPITSPGMKRLALDDGRHVNWIDSKTFKIVETDQIIRKIP